MWIENEVYIGGSYEVNLIANLKQEMVGANIDLLRPVWNETHFGKSQEYFNIFEFHLKCSMRLRIPELGTWKAA